MTDIESLKNYDLSGLVRKRQMAEKETKAPAAEAARESGSDDPDASVYLKEPIDRIVPERKKKSVRKDRVKGSAGEFKKEPSESAAKSEVRSTRVSVSYPTWMKFKRLYLKFLSESDKKLTLHEFLTYHLEKIIMENDK